MLSYIKVGAKPAEVDMNVLKTINKMRLDRGWSVYRLSVESGVPQSTLTNMFNRETSPSIATLECICTAFGISLSEFFGSAQETTPHVGDDEVLALYHGLSDEVKKSVLTLMRELSNK